MSQLISVTGGSGFIGSHVVDALLGAGHRVRVIDRIAPMQPEAEWRGVDLLDENALTNALAGSDFVFHLAAMADVNDVLSRPAESVALNTLGTATVLQAARRADTGRVILASTVWVYAATHGDVVDEDTPFDLQLDKHLYVSEKLASEMFCRDYANLYGRPYTVLRYGIPYGPRMRSDLVVAAFLERGLRGEAIRIDGDGSQGRRFVYVEDLAAAHLLALAPVAENRTYNLESTETTSIRDIALHVQALVGDVEVSFGPARPGDYRAREVRSDRARDELGWHARTAFTDGLARTLGWYVAQGAAPVATPAVPAPAASTSSTPERAAVVGTRARRRIAVVPAYNEEPTVVGVLDALAPLVDELVVVDDGSTDGTRAEVERWLTGQPHARLLCHDVNQGMSEAYLLALSDLQARLEAGELDADDLVFTVDADGQHDLAVLDELADSTVAEGLDAMLACRDLSYHGPFKRAGNWVLSMWASVWAGIRLHDVESGYRVFRLGALAHALDYYSGHKYSETVEVAVVMGRLGYRVRNDHVVPVPVARSRTSITDAVIDATMIPIAAWRVWKADTQRRAPATLPITGVVALLLAVTVGHGVDAALPATLGAAAAVAAALLVRRLVPGGGLPLMGATVAIVSAWLAGQQPDLVSTVLLAVLFSAGLALASPPSRALKPWVLGASGVAVVALRIDDHRTALLLVAVAVAVAEASLGLLRRRARAPALRIRRAAVGSTVVATAALMTLYFGASTVSATWFGGGVVHGPRGSNEVALTFDAGPDLAATQALMQVLGAQHVPAAFFVVGEAARKNPQLVRALYEQGFLVGNQSYHGDGWRWMDPRYPELARAQKTVANVLGGVCPAWYRPPRGRKTPFIAAAAHDHGMKMVLWDVSAGTAPASDASGYAQHVLRQVQGGSIIDLRAAFDDDSAAGRAALLHAVPEIIAGLRARHLQPVRLDQLLGAAAYTVCT